MGIEYRDGEDPIDLLTRLDMAKIGLRTIEKGESGQDMLKTILMLLPSMYSTVVNTLESGADSKLSRSDIVCRVRSKYERA